jgi:hypothetical protein
MEDARIMNYPRIHQVRLSQRECCPKSRRGNRFPPSEFRDRPALPLSGTIKAQGLTQSELEQALAKKFRSEYLRNPKVILAHHVIGRESYNRMAEDGGTSHFTYIDRMFWRMPN